MKSTQKNRQRQQWIVIGLVGAIGVMAVALLIFSMTSQPAPSPNTGQIIATMDPAIIANLTALPNAPALSGEEAQAVQAIADAVTACPDYSTERRRQMEQHIFWLNQPSQIPPDIILALGPNPTGRLIYGMAVYTSTEWRLQERPNPSCLLDIGLALNTLLIANDEPALTIYAATPAP